MASSAPSEIDVLLLSSVVAQAGDAAFIAAILDTVASLVIVVDRNGCVRRFNRACEQLTGYPRDEVLGRPMRGFVAEEDRACADAVFRGFCCGEAVEQCENHWITRDGRRRAIRWVNTVLCDAHGEPEYLIGTGTDVTDTERMAEEIRNIQRLESLAHLAGGIAHDFNNLLMGILGSISLARGLVNDPRRLARHLDEAERTVGVATGLTEQLLTFARGGEPKQEQIDIGALISQAAVFATRGANVRCELDLPDDLPGVLGDGAQLTQVFQNLLINARQAMPSGGVVRVSAATERAEDGEEQVRISVRDFGPGVPPDIAERVFDPFFTTRAGGTGLGLATAHSIARRHRGTIRLRNADEVAGGGAIFEVRLPTIERPRREAKAPKRRHPVKPRPGSVLLMDDDAAVRSVLTAMLEHLGRTVVAAEEGESALELFRQARDAGAPFDLVIMDLTVPGGMGGVETLERMVDLDPNVSAVVSSGYANDPVIAHPERFGFVGVLPKPFLLDDLENLLRLLDSRSK